MSQGGHANGHLSASPRRVRDEVRALAIQRVTRMACVALLCIAFPSHDARAGDGWVKIDESDGITIYKKDVPGSDVIAVRGEGLVAAPLARVASVVFDTSRAAEWIDSLAEARVVRRISDLEYVEYDHFTMPLVITDRDFVTSNKLEYDATRKAIIIRIRSVTDTAAPASQFVRGEVVSSTFVLTEAADGKGTWVSGDVHADPKGSLPAWIVNMFQKDWPHATLTHLRTQVKKTNITENPAVKRLVP